MAWICHKANGQEWHVGYLRGESFQAIFAHATEADARADVHYLNGGSSVDMTRIVEELQNLATAIWREK